MYLYRISPCTTISYLAMLPSLPQSLQPESENNLPNCLYMKLAGIPVQPTSQELEFWQTPTQTQQINLQLTISFSEQWECLGEGRIKFGLKGGELRLKLENSEIPYESRTLAGHIRLSLPQNQRQSQTTKQPNSINIRELAKNIFSKKVKSDTESNVVKSKSSSANQYPISLCHVTTKISEENPVWVFEEERDELALKGSLIKVNLATLNILALPCRVEATFEVSQRNVCLTDAEGLWLPDISRNKKAVLEKLIVQRLLEPKIKPYLSRAELRYE
ncbi:MAG: hypothetical protein F6K31_08315 [Symploca sp. SIO2G7]|nr:hypothetical protein [Symploca sp. SIO2G7]